MSPIVTSLGTLFKGRLLCLENFTAFDTTGTECLAPLSADTNHAAWKQAVSSVHATPDWILLGVSTPSILTAQVLSHFPDAGLAFLADEGWWIIRDSTRQTASNENQVHGEDTLATVILSEVPAYIVKPEMVQPELQLPPELQSIRRPDSVTAIAEAIPEKKANKSQPFSEQDTNQLLQLLFLQYAWGKSGHDSNIVNLEIELQKRGVSQFKIEKSKINGRTAHALQDELEKRMQHYDGTEQPIRDWFQELEKNNNNKKFMTHLHKKFNENVERWKNKRARAQTEGQVYQSSVKPPAMCDGVHPNSVQHLQPATSWDILIDETGKFDATSTEAGYNSPELGRVVALVVPRDVKLDPLPPRFHATDQKVAINDSVASHLLDKPVGIFGFTRKEEVTQGGSWFSQVRTLIQWVLMQLPVAQNGTVSEARFFVEQNGGYDATISLALLQEIVVDEMLQIDAQRYAHFNVRIEFIAKDGHPYNGYVDAVAYTWGSQHSANKDRLKKSKWIGHCLLRADQDAMERLYWSINHHTVLSSFNWLEMCAALNEEPESGLIHGFMQRIGETVKKKPHAWHGYLQAVQDSLRLKNYSLPNLSQALNWLDHWRPDEVSFPKPLQLELYAARLALNNHRGKLDADLMLQCIDLARELKDEDAPHCCEVILRVASLSTNSFEFDAVQAELESWLQEPVAVVGRLNHGKLHSALGQLYAFTGQYDQALQHFDQAITIFSSLSDPAQAKRETSQTGSYRLIALIDSTAEDEVVKQALTTYLQAATGKPELGAIARSLATGKHDTRFVQHLALRACITRPSMMAAFVQQYLLTSSAWFDESADFPWPLILAYRGWLQAQNPAAASKLFSQGIADCFEEDTGPTLHWIGHMLSVLAYKYFALPLDDTLLDMVPLTEVLAAIPKLPAKALNEQYASPVEFLRRVLPFNFH